MLPAVYKNLLNRQVLRNHAKLKIGQPGLAANVLLAAALAYSSDSTSRAAPPTATSAASAPSTQVPSGEELLARLRSADEVYRKGFTASGQHVFALKLAYWYAL